MENEDDFEQCDYCGEMFPAGEVEEDENRLSQICRDCAEDFADY